MAENYYGGYQYPFRDFTDTLGRIGSDLGDWNKRRQLGNALSSLGPDASLEEMARAIQGIDPALGLKTMIEARQAQALEAYRRDSLNQKAEPSVEDQLLRQYLTPRGPSYLSPPDTESAADAAEEAEASGVTGTAYTRPSLDNAPAIVQQKLLPLQEQERLKNAGGKQGDREAFRAALSEQAPQVNELVKTLVSQVREADEGTFANALGPLQGVSPPEDWRGTITSGVPQTLGAISNYLEKGSEEGFTTGEGKNWRFKEPGELGGGFTDTLRTQVLSTQASLVGVMQRLLRIPGIGAQSDYELRQIIAQAGELSKARTKEDFQARLSTVLSNLKAIGIPLNVPGVEEVAGKKSTDRYANPATPPAADNASAGGVNEHTMVGGQDIGRTTNQPPTPPARALNALKAYRNNPAAIAAFDEIYGPGAAEFYLQKSR